MKTTKSKEVEPSNTFVCATCGQKEQMEHPEAMKHLQEIHGIDTKGLKAVKKTVAHLDGDTWFSWQYEIVIPSAKGDVTLYNEVICPRAMDDMMRWA